ncbi:MAG: hypothetical protein M3P42_03185 [Actinomycetota bacterium]|nr:hypothetical protein [Actinomycetota bacterium]
MRWLLASVVVVVLALGAAFDETDPTRNQQEDGVWLQRVLVTAGFWALDDVDPSHPSSYAISTGGPRSLYVWSTPGVGGLDGRRVSDGVRIHWESQGLRIWVEPTGPWDPDEDDVRRLIRATHEVPRGWGSWPALRAKRREPLPVPCRGRPLPRGPSGLPAPVELWTSCGVFVVGTDGRVSTRPGRGRWEVVETRPLRIKLPPPFRHPRRIGVYSGVVRDSAGRFEAFTATEGYDGHVARGYEAIYVRQPGGPPRPVHRQPLLFTLCGRGVQLSWHGSWLLYGVGEGHAVAIDTATGRRIDLTRTLRRLPGTHPSSHGYRLSSAYWAGAPPSSVASAISWATSTMSLLAL